MPIDESKKRIVLLTYDEIVNLNNLARMHLDENGAPKILQIYPVSEEYAKILESCIKAMTRVLEEIWKSEDDGKRTDL